MTPSSSDSPTRVRDRNTRCTTTTPGTGRVVIGGVRTLCSPGEHKKGGESPGFTGVAGLDVVTGVTLGPWTAPPASTTHIGRHVPRRPTGLGKGKDRTQDVTPDRDGAPSHPFGHPTRPTPLPAPHTDGGTVPDRRGPPCVPLALSRPTPAVSITTRDGVASVARRGVQITAQSRSRSIVVHSPTSPRPARGQKGSRSPHDRTV